MEALNEVYFGREPVAPLQHQLTKLRDKLGNKMVTSTTNIDPEILKFNRLAEQIFGFKSFALYIQPNHVPNAYAFPVGIFISDEEKRKIRNSLITSPTGFRYSDAFQEVNLIIAIHSGLLDDPSYSDEEIMATILHEIGHGFFEAVTDKDGEYTIAKKITQIFHTINKLAYDKIKNGKKLTKEIIDKELHAMSGIIGSVKDRFEKAKTIIFKESMNDNMKKNRLSYTNEKFADTFAAMYGYGEECHSVDIKIFQNVYNSVHGVKTYPKIIETIKMYKLYITDAFEYALNLKDEHPDELARVATTVAYIKKELAKDSIDPKLKMELLAELEKMNKLIDEFINFPKDKDSMRILRLYYIKLYEKFGGDRREKDTDNDALFDTIDNRYDELNNK